MSELRHKSHASNQRDVVHLPGHGRQALDDLESFQQVWPLTQFSSNYKQILGGQIVKKSFIRLEGKSMIPHRRETNFSSVAPSNSLVSVSDP